MESVIQCMLIKIPRRFIRIKKISLISIFLYAIGCANDTPSVVGGWYNHLGQYACFRTDHRLGIGDHVKEALAGTSTWFDDNRLKFSDGVTGSWNIISDGSLEILAENCRKGCDENPMKFQRNNSFGCPE